MKKMSIKERFMAQTDVLGAECAVVRGFSSDAGEVEPVDLIVRTGVDVDRFRDMPVEERKRVLRWICENVLPDEQVCHRMSSYGMKHVLEHQTGIYMTNNQFKDAMMICGFYPETVDELNWYFFISPKSPVLR